MELYPTKLHIEAQTSMQWGLERYSGLDEVMRNLVLEWGAIAFSKTAKLGGDKPLIQHRGFSGSGSGLEI